MARAGGNLGVWGSLVLLGLQGCCTVVRAAAPNLVRTVTEARTTSSITLNWEVPEATDPQNPTYRTQWAGDSDRNNAHDTTEISVVVDGLAPASSYDRVENSTQAPNATTVPNPVRNLTVESQSTSSISLTWGQPEGPSMDNFTYWAQCIGSGDKHETRNTTDTHVTVDGLDPGSSYECSVWVQRDGLNSSKETVYTSTVPNPVRNLTVESQSTSSISLTWGQPEGPSMDNFTYWAQCIGSGDKHETRNTTDTHVTVDGLDPGSSYECSVWVQRDGLNSSKETVYTSTVPNPVRNLTVESQSTSSISLTWGQPEGPSMDNFTYWAQCIGSGDKHETRNTTDTHVTVDGLDPGSSYECSVWVQRDGLNSSKETVYTSTVPNPVRNLTVESQSTSSISLTWGQPEGPSMDNFTYWAQCIGSGDKHETRNTTDTHVTVDGLDPGSSYECSVWVQRDGLNSSKETVYTSTVPNPVRNLTVESQSTSSISLTWGQPEGPSMDNFTYWAQCIGSGDKHETRNTTDTHVTVDGLDPGSSYECSVWVQRDGLNSSKETVYTSTVPNPVRNLTVESQSTSSISLTWGQPEGPSMDNFTYWAQCIGSGDKHETRNTTDTHVTVDGLDPGSSYECSVWVQRDGLNSSKETVYTSTVPNPVRNLTVESQSTSSISLTWGQPEGPSMDNFTYWAQCIGSGDKHETRNTTDTHVTVDGLDPGSSYECSVWVQRDGLNSSKETVYTSTAPNPVTNLSLASRTNNSITLSWEAPGDPDLQGYAYVVHYTGDGKKNKTQDTTDTRIVIEELEAGTFYNFSVWARRNGVVSRPQTIDISTVPAAVNDISCVSTSGGYGVILTWSCPSGGYEMFEVEVGSQWSSLNGSFCGKGMSVSDLGPAQSYTATITTVSNGLKVRSISVICYTESTGVIVGAILGILLLFILVGLLIFFLKKRRKKSQHKEAARDLVFSFPGDIPAKDFADHVRENEKDSNYGFAREYQQLSLEDQGQSQMTALAPENASKNRYRNVLPYDCSRVPLKLLHEKPGSDYINASFMPGLWSPKEFIATQGPLPHTVSDFWRLVWEQQSRTLVMLTNCMESGLVKCEHYWPLDAQPCTHGQLKVTLINEETKENWIVRDLQLFHVGKQQLLPVRQFHYVAWPDHGVPYSPDPLLDFHKVLRQWLDQTVNGGPPIVHCSAGVGRTGTLIALDVLLRQLECEGLVGPFSFVKKMRQSRPLMVQTEAQYVFLHQCILRSLQKPAPALMPKEAIYENVANVIYENVDAIYENVDAKESKVSASGC